MHTFNSLNILLASTEIILFGLIILFLLLSLLVGKGKDPEATTISAAEIDGIIETPMTQTMPMNLLLTK